MRTYCSILRSAGNIILLVFFLLSPSKAQEIVVSGGSGKVYSDFEKRIDALVMLNGSTPSTELKVLTELSVEWYEYFNLSYSPEFHTTPVFLSNQTSISPDDHCGYLVKLSGMVDGKPYTRNLSVFVVDYQKYKWDDVVLAPLTGATGECDKLTLELKGNLKPMQYATSNGLLYPLNRELKLNFETLEWNNQWSTQQVNRNVTPVDGKVDIYDPLLRDTYFEISGDQFSQDLGIASFVSKSGLYAARRVACKITTEAAVRTETHEVDRPGVVSAISGSAPLELLMKANGNEPVSNYYNWTIQSGDEVLLSRTDATHTYTFLQAGTFLVKVRAENSYCSYTDSITVKISESAISAPNVFSPNGDEINDEFRVAYKSIVEFQGIIFNRWGTKIFEWTDIQKGWNGTLNGKPVSEGAYFYVIRAKGSDGIIYNLKGDINLLRGNK